MKNSSVDFIDNLFLRFPNICERKNIENACNILCETIRNGGKIMSAGNGGSALHAMHITSELSKSFLIKRNNTNGTENAFKAISLVSETALITAIANDMGYEYIFSQQLHSLGEKNDVLILISTSGNSENILLASDEAKRKNIKTIALTGKNAHKLENQCDEIIKTNETDIYKIQDSHSAIYHTICAVVENEFFGD